jgi:hypothetical protein
MAWLKRNLYFVITSAIGLAVTGYCGFLLYTALGENRGVSDEYGTTLNSLREFEQKTPAVNKQNIASAKEDQERVRAFLADFRKAFLPFPNPPKVNELEFKDYLLKTIYELGQEATNAGVLLPPGYSFCFSQQKDKLSYSPECIAPWMQQLEEIKAIVHILFRAKINYLEEVQRCPVCSDEGGGSEYIQTSSVSNQWGVVTPYKVMFRGFSTEIAAVLAGFAASSNCFIVKDIDVTPSRAPLPQVVPPPATPATPPPVYVAAPQPTPFQMSMERDMRGRGRPGTPGGYPGGYMRPLPQAAPAAAAPAPAGPETILTESLLFVTLVVDVVKLK